MEWLRLIWCIMRRLWFLLIVLLYHDLVSYRLHSVLMVLSTWFTGRAELTIVLVTIWCRLGSDRRWTCVSVLLCATLWADITSLICIRLGVLMAMTRLNCTGTVLRILVNSGILRMIMVLEPLVIVRCLWDSVRLQTNGRLTLLSPSCNCLELGLVNMRLVTYCWPSCFRLASVLGLKYLVTRWRLMLFGLIIWCVSLLQLTSAVLSLCSSADIASPFVVTLLANFTWTTSFYYVTPWGLRI